MSTVYPRVQARTSHSFIKPLFQSPTRHVIKAGMLLLLMVGFAVQAAAQGKIAFTSTLDGNEEIYVMNADGTGQTRLTNNAAADVDPSISADGSKIVFTSQRDGFDEIYVMNADGTGQTRLTNNNAIDAQPTFSTDGSKIAFNSQRDGNFEIYVMNADGTNPIRLTNNRAADAYPSFSPDGSKIAFSSARDGNLRIYVMNADGTNQTGLTNNGASEYSLSWGGSTVSDSDNDGVPDAQDNCPNVANANQLDTDGDGRGDACDEDDDGDGVNDALDCAPLDATRYRSGSLYVDSDGDGFHTGSETVCYGATVPAGYVATTKGPDNCPSIANPVQTDTDGDGQGDACDLDDDGDGVPDTRDNCPLVSNANQADLDSDGKGDACDDDADGDGIADAYDCEPGNKKVAKYLVCHKGQTLCVDKQGMQDHVKHGDKLGPCGTTTSIAIPSETPYEIPEQAPAISGVYPNPSRGVFSLQLNNASAGRVQVLVLDAKGVVLERRTIQASKGRQTLSFNLQGKAAGLYLLKVLGAAEDQLFKVYIQQ